MLSIKQDRTTHEVHQNQTDRMNQSGSKSWPSSEERPFQFTTGHLLVEREHFFPKGSIPGNQKAIDKVHLGLPRQCKPTVLRFKQDRTIAKNELPHLFALANNTIPTCVRFSTKWRFTYEESYCTWCCDAAGWCRGLCCRREEGPCNQIQRKTENWLCV